MIKADQLVTQAVYVSTEASLARQHIFVVVNILVQEGTILELLLREVNSQLLRAQNRADGLWFIRFVGFLNAPEVAADFIPDARGSH